MPFTQVELRCGGLVVNIQSELAYPDAMDDICARTLNLFKESVNTCKENDIDITVMSLHATGFDDDYED